MKLLDQSFENIATCKKYLGIRGPSLHFLSFSLFQLKRCFVTIGKGAFFSGCVDLAPTSRRGGCWYPLIGEHSGCQTCILQVRNCFKQSTNMQVHCLMPLSRFVGRLQRASTRKPNGLSSHKTLQNIRFFRQYDTPRRGVTTATFLRLVT